MAMAKQDEVRDRIAKAADILIGQGVATKSTINGCSAKEIEEVEVDVEQPLPLAYRQFLATMGRGAGRFFVGTDLFFPGVIGNTEAAHELVAEDKSGLALPKDAIAFMMHQGYQFMFIRADEGDDPPVYHYIEQSGEFAKKAEKLTQFLIDVAHDDW